MHSQPSPLGEFDLIDRFFKTRANPLFKNSYLTLKLGIGDDCALINPPVGEEIAVTSDMLVEGRHFFAETDAEQLGHKALAVNLSDLAAMGASPLGFTLAISIPAINEAWLGAFSKGLLDLANQFACPLIGGDTTAGPLTISITAFGSIPSGKAIRRSGAKIDDDIWVSGTLGDARLTLAALRHEIHLTEKALKLVENRMHQPLPRLELGKRLREIASAALDISDGLLGDLRHILRQSEVSAEIVLDQLPKSATLQEQEISIQNLYAASGGDDYELCFTAPESHRANLLKISNEFNLPLTRIGKIVPIQNNTPEIRLFNTDGSIVNETQTAILLKSFNHFAI
ncbi:thiamine-phosphate kinase [Polynucleobacter necessarius]|uniref:thiamine-phosphate kinase n=1 Tax=Polynucleobacter necessarius TaxID=576610 RepID=UPI000E09C374|nr:thiamine-phosphate kinase [Polynucleobacter necessarius]